MEFFLHFFKLLGKDLLVAVDFARIYGDITPSINATFLPLIPKKDKPVTFLDFQPISLCNLVYKLISKVIAIRLKPFLNMHISR